MKADGVCITFLIIDSAILQTKKIDQTLTKRKESALWKPQKKSP